jgi:uncharacterized protein YdiU (UPF0061 family)
MRFGFDTTYARLPNLDRGRFYTKVAPSRVSAPHLVKVNRPLAALLGLDPDALATPDGVAALAGNVVPEDATPMALAYAGHQFGNFVRLGDGRAILLGEIVGKDGKRRDLQLKGAGRTPYSRGGDGRAALGPVLREYVVSEAMAAMGIPTTRALAALTTGDPVHREEVLPGAILVRVASSHLRIGTFELLAAQDDREGLRALVRYALERHYPAHVPRDGAASPSPGLALLDQVVSAQASLVARWMGVGFVHGVMNTDNMSISGETLDYGPCAFLDEYDPQKRFSFIDRGGRYAYGNQPRIALWNLARLAEALLTVLADDDTDEEELVRLATARLEEFLPRFRRAHAAVLRAKLGLACEEDADVALAEDLLGRMAASHVDFTLFFRRLAGVPDGSVQADTIAGMFEDPGAWTTWAEAWHARLAREHEPARAAVVMRAANPAFIPRNHRVEEAIRAATEDDFGPFETLVRVLARPFDDQPDDARSADPPLAAERVERTFCGT